MGRRAHRRISTSLSQEMSIRGLITYPRHPRGPCSQSWFPTVSPLPPLLQWEILFPCPVLQGLESFHWPLIPFAEPLPPSTGLFFYHPLACLDFSQLPDIGPILTFDPQGSSRCLAPHQSSGVMVTSPTTK